MKRFLVLVSTAMSLSGCGIREANLRAFPDQRPLTAIERQTIISEVKNTFFDPYTIRDAELSNAAPTADIAMNTNYLVCVRANAKNRMGAYTGREATLYNLNSTGQITRTGAGDPFCDNQQLRYAPFPEIQQAAR